MIMMLQHDREKTFHGTFVLMCKLKKYLKATILLYLLYYAKAYKELGRPIPVHSTKTTQSHICGGEPFTTLFKIWPIRD